MLFGVYVLWFIAAGLCTTGLAALYTIGVPLVAAGAALVAFLAYSKRLRPAWPGAIAGPAAPLVYIAYLNRSGPGTVCTGSATGSSCTDQYAPWPFLVTAVVFVLLALICGYLRPRPVRRGR